ncbi:hypothetical protein T265_13542 [Opisthorchis viverrini]|uniref:Neutral ceramidase n=1 Tax=Opisthorchis viverrini TaxID=6198 RepID=A0A074ZS28_OPIVI|nr:hypothetical protein T265_13542 [Opisthorchis viverrini]KER28637.1 hypothetical protein T265_13542 [Opisthorchis viverrini]
MMCSIPVLLLFQILTISPSRAYRFGLGMFDITGPAAEVNMMGYARPGQNTQGIHTRLFSRAFIIQEDGPSPVTVLFINLDVGMISQLLKTQVVMELQKRYDGIFNHSNVLLSATHTHSGPGGYFQYFLYSVTSLGFVKQNFDAMVTGIIKSVEIAKSNMMNGKIYVAKGDVLNASINRSPASYELNPAEERKRYQSNVDTEMVLLKFVNSSGHPVGMLNWFAVHATSMNMTNTLISSDNKGLAALMFEERLNGHRNVGQGPFVGAFAQANEGDVSPNLRGPKCIDTGRPCDYVHGSCNGRTQKCIAFGPGQDMFESTKIIAQRQYEKAWELFEAAKEEISGSISFTHQFVDMTKMKVQYGGYNKSTCKPAMGYSFAAGTMDGPGDFDFVQGTKATSLFWNIIRDLIKRPSKELKQCHAPKPILLATGELTRPLEWQPAIVETQVLRIGTFLIVALPGEFTTMSGRRIRNAVTQVVHRETGYWPRFKGPSEFHVVLAGLSNVYTSYVATPEEYELQRYEGASTIYGPLTLPAYVEQFQHLTTALMKGTQLPPGPTPPYLKDHLFSGLPPVLFDAAPFGFKFGDVIVPPKSIYTQEDKEVTVRFIGANPRNDVRQNGTFLTVDKYDERTETWNTEFTDANWETKFIWSRLGRFGWLLGHSEVEIRWRLKSWKEHCSPGMYRIQYYGAAKYLTSRHLHYFTGTTGPFQVTC